MADKSYHFFNNKEKAKKYCRVNEENIQKSTFFVLDGKFEKMQVLWIQKAINNNKLF